MIIWLSIDTRGRIWAQFKVIFAEIGWFTWMRILTQTLDDLDLIHHSKYLLTYMFNEWLSICRHPTFKQTLHFHWIWRKVIFYLTVDFCIVCKMGDMRRRRPANNFLPFGNYPQQLKVFLADIFSIEKLLTLNNILPPACFPWESTSAWFSWLAGCTSATRATIGEIHGAPVVRKYKYKVEHKFKICCCYGEENRVVLAVLRRLLCCEITAGASCQGNINALPRKSTLPQFHLLTGNKDKGLLPKFILSEHIKKPKEIPAFNWGRKKTI